MRYYVDSNVWIDGVNKMGKVDNGMDQDGIEGKKSGYQVGMLNNKGFLAVFGQGFIRLEGFVVFIL